MDKTLSMEDKNNLDEFLTNIRIPSDLEVEAAGLRFDKRLKKMKSRRRIMWISSSVAAIFVAAILATPLFNTQEPVREMVDNTKTSVPKLILSNGSSIDLNTENIGEKIQATNVRVTNKHIVYNMEKRPEIKDAEIKNIEYNTLVIPAGYTYDVTLADGTQVTLNAGSRLKYPVEFTGKTREVELSGEAYFHVKKSDKVFEVNVSGSRIRVYGTQFNVKTLQQNNILETVLVEGSIGFTSPGQKEIKIVPGEEITFDAESGEIEVRQVDTQNATMWKKGVFRYQERKLNLVLEDISAWYDVDFESSIDAADIEITMNLGKNTPIEEVVSFIELITNHKIIKEGGRYVIK